ncbi:GTPase [Thermomonas aquatica]|uniref:GTPase n=1 Tax=Thermomonas aquatica TaxID=2202149 RepID=A0A5B7ZQU0_9GAMM|nr:GTPase [Thermomonas aquatica]
MTQFTWIPTFRAIAEWLRTYRTRQPDLITVLHKVGITSGLEDRDENENSIPLDEIDPFTFYCLFTKYGVDQRLKLVARLIETAGISATLPTDFDGVPSANAMKVWMFPFKAQREPWMVSTLWDLFEQALRGEVKGETFNRCLTIKNTGFAKLTECLFYIAPEKYFPVDGQTKPWLAARKISLPESSWESYQAFLPRLMQASNQSFASLSHEAWVTNQAAAFTKESAIVYLDARFPGTRTGTSHIAAWHTPEGRALATDPSPKRVAIFIEMAPPFLDQEAIEPYPAERPRNHHLGAHAPALAAGKQAYLATLATLADLQKLCDWYADGAAQPSADTTSRIAEPTDMSPPPLNQILFGPPGTGKTYYTINHSLEIVDPAFLAANALDRAALTERFRELVAEERIRFVTFHQSFSYEDFVEGLRAETDRDDNLVYKVEPGVFKRLCETASGVTEAAREIGISDAPRIWKLSIDSTHASKTRDYCFTHNEARIGWGLVGDLAKVTRGSHAGYDALGTHNQNTVHSFANEVEVGDIILCIRSAEEIQAVGVVQGEYRYEPTVPAGVLSDYNNVLPVRWLATGLNLNIKNVNGGVRFTLKTLYELTRVSWPELAQALEKAGVALTSRAESSMARRLPNKGQPYVLIIDEINRGSVSRIFGELITLIEPSKRAGEVETLEVTLPYSKNPFSVPSNIYLIGTMNTADRSLAAIDIALRRRFQFIPMLPDVGVLRGISVDGVKIDAMLQGINDRIECLHGRDFQIGHAYFLKLKDSATIAALSSIFRQQVLPLLQEYFFEDWQKIAWVLSDELKSPEDQFLKRRTAVMAGLEGQDNMPEKTLWSINTKAFDRIGAYQGIKLGSIPA